MISQGSDHESRRGTEKFQCQIMTQSDLDFSMKILEEKWKIAWVGETCGRQHIQQSN